MKKVLLAALIGLFLSNVLQAQVEKAFDFSDVCSSGQTLYYKILDEQDKNRLQIQNTSNAVSVTYPYGERKNGIYSWGWDGYAMPEGNLAIPAKVTNNGIIYTVVCVGGYAFQSCNEITSVIIPNTILVIESHAFESCTALQSVTLPNSVKEIGISAFEKTGLKTLQLPNSLSKIGDHAFSYCYQLESVTLPSNLKETSGWLFGCCYKLKSVNLPSSLKKIKGGFEDCSSLSITVPNTVTEVWSMTFKNCLNVIYHGKLKDAPWGAKCLNGYVEGGCVYKDKTKKTLVAISREEEERRQKAAYAEQERQKLAERNNRASQVNVGNVMSYVKSFELMDNSPSRTSYHVNFYGVSNNYSSSIIYHSGHWWYYYHDDTFMANPDSKEGAILGLWKHFNDIGLFD